MQHTNKYLPIVLATLITLAGCGGPDPARSTEAASPPTSEATPEQSIRTIPALPDGRMAPHSGPRPGESAVAAVEEDWQPRTSEDEDPWEGVDDADDLFEELVDEDRRLVLPADGLFSTGSTDIDPVWVQALKDFAVAVRDVIGPTEIVLISGHVDDRGPEDYNLALATARAQAVGEILREAAPELTSRIVERGHGEQERPDPSCTGDCPTNRVVCLRIIERDIQPGSACIEQRASLVDTEHHKSS